MTFIKYILTPFILIFTLWLAGHVWFAVSTLTMRPQSTLETTDAIVVLTGGDQRIETGLALFARGRAQHLFITGVHPDVSKSDIEKMWAEQTSLPPCCITLGHQATTTIGNGVETKEWIAAQNYTSIRLITSDYHMNRALLELHHVLPGIEIIPHPIMQPNLGIKNRHFWELLVSEYHKTLFRGLTILFPALEPLAERKFL